MNQADSNVQMHQASTADTNNRNKIYEYITSDNSKMTAATTAEPQLNIASTSIDPLSLITSSAELGTNSTEQLLILTNDDDQADTDDSDFLTDADQTTTSMHDETVDIIRRMDNYRDDDGGTGIGSDDDNTNLNAQLVDESFFPGPMLALPNVENETSTINVNDSEEAHVSSASPNPTEITTLDVAMITPDYNDNGDDIDAITDTETDTEDNGNGNESSSTVVTPTTSTYATLIKMLASSSSSSAVPVSRHDRTSDLGSTVSTIEDVQMIPSSTVPPTTTSTSTTPASAARGVTDKSDINIKLGINCYLKNYFKHLYIMCT